MVPESAFGQLPQLLGGVLRLEVDAYAALHTLPGAGDLAWLVVLAAGFSEALGHSLTLFVNRVRLRRFAVALFFVAFSWSLGFVLWFSSIWAVAGWFAQDLVWYDFIRTLSFACLPLCGLFLNALPYFGVAVSVSLTFYSLLCVVTGVEALTDLGTLEAFACAAFGWVTLQLLQRTVGRPMVALGKQLERRFAGAAVRSDRRELAELVRAGAGELQTLLKEK